VDIVMALSIGFLCSPMVGYLVLASNMAPRKKLIIAVAGMLLMLVVPVLVMLLAGSVLGPVQPAEGG
jgi:hypothetical protein